MKNIFFILALAVVLVGCDTEEETMSKRGGYQIGNKTLKTYLMDAQTTDYEEGTSQKTVYTYNDNDNVTRIDYFQNEELYWYSEYRYADNKRYGVSYLADGTINSYDTIYYSDIKTNKEERIADYCPSRTNSEWTVNTYEYDGLGKLINHKSYVNGELRSRCDYTYSNNYRYGITTGYSNHGENYLESRLDTLSNDLYGRTVYYSCLSTYKSNVGATSVSFSVTKTEYLDDVSDRIAAEYYYNDNDSHSIKYTWENETTRLGTFGNGGKILYRNTAHFHMKK